MTDIMTTACQDGQNANPGPAPHLWSSDLWMAFRAGQQMAGTSLVVRCRKSRGHSIRAETIGGNAFIVKFAGKNLSSITVDRA
jgi:hypothetical protein